MSISRKIVEHALADNGDKARSAIVNSINEKVADLLEMKKIELAGGSLVSEEESCEDKDYIKGKMEKTAKKIKKLKEEISILEDYLAYVLSEAYKCDDEDDEDPDADDVADELDKKKSKLAKKEMKMDKLKEAYALLEGEEDEIDETGEWEDEESEESSEEN